MDEDFFITQIGMILTQLRATRRAIEEIERSTARYAGGSFVQAAVSGGRFGAPPLQNGALRVFIVNINDLAPSGGGFLEQLLGGVGRFVGGIFGGLAGGTVAGVALPGMIRDLNQIAGRVERIMGAVNRFMDRLDIRRQASTPTQPGGGLLDQIDRIMPMVRTLTGLFTAASSGPNAAAAAGTAVSAAALGWLDTLRQVQGTLEAVNRLVDGLVRLVPVLIGAFATVVASLADIQVAALDLMQFLLRNFFLLRGVILLTLWDTIGMAARVGAEILGIVQRAITPLLTALFGMAEQVVQAGAAALRFVGGALSRTVDGLLRWMLGTLMTTLTALGDTRIFRFILYLFQQLPDILPSVIAVLAFARGASFTEARTFAASQAGALERAARRTVAPPSFPGGLAGLPTAPDVGALVAPPAAVNALTDSLRQSGAEFSRNVAGAVGVVRGAVSDGGAAADREARTGSRAFGSRLGPLLAPLGARANELAAALTPAAEAARRDRTGLEEIAAAYERWLSGGGMNALLGSITEHFRTTPLGSPSLPAAVAAGSLTLPRATVEIGELVIDVAPPAAAAEPLSRAGMPDGLAVPGSTSIFELQEELDVLRYRGWRDSLG